MSIVLGAEGGRRRGHLFGGIGVQLGVVGDELHDGVPDLLRGKLPSALYKQQADVHKPLQVWVEPAQG